MYRLTMRLLAATAMLVTTTVASTAAAQSYSFGVPVAEMQVFVQPDASVRIVYDITFRNNPGGRAIDVVDVGTPTKEYGLKNVKAESGKRPLRKIRRSTEIACGFEVHMGPATIPPGGEGKLHVEFTIPNLVFQDTTRKDYASLRITPTWFGAKYVRGMTHLKVAIHLPKGVKPEEALYQDEKQKFTHKVVSEGRTSVVWEWKSTRFTKAHMVAVSFPKRDMKRVVTVTKLDLLLKWFRESPGARFLAGAIFLVLFGIAFFRFTGGTGIVVYVILSGLAVVVFVFSPGWHLASLPIVLVLVGLNEWFLRRRKVSYMPPIAQVEGGEIKRGLTAPEAAVLLEMPLSRVLGLVVFGMLRKGILHQLTAEPLCVSVDEAFRIKEGELLADEKERYKFFRQAGQKTGIVVHKYEHPFIYLLDANPGKPVKEIEFTVPLKKLIERAAARMRGHDLSDTQDYYRSIVRRACTQAASVGDVPQREKAIDRNFEWILMDDDWPAVFTYGRPYHPVWTRGPTVSTSGGGSAPAPAAPSAPGIPGQTSFGDVAGSFAGWTENTMGSMASAISPGALNLQGPAGGFLDLGGADRVTGQFFQALAEAAESSGGGGGGGGGGCACACAGCACACACAGGGR